MRGNETHIVTVTVTGRRGKGVTSRGGWTTSTFYTGRVGSVEEEVKNEMRRIRREMRWLKRRWMKGTERWSYKVK